VRRNQGTSTHYSSSHNLLYYYHHVSLFRSRDAAQRLSEAIVLVNFLPQLSDTLSTAPLETISHYFAIPGISQIIAMPRSGSAKLSRP
jgi:hypothetical protein